MVTRSRQYGGKRGVCGGGVRQQAHETAEIGLSLRDAGPPRTRHSLREKAGPPRFWGTKYAVRVT